MAGTGGFEEADFREALVKGLRRSGATNPGSPFYSSAVQELSVSRSDFGFPGSVACAPAIHFGSKRDYLTVLCKGKRHWIQEFTQADLGLAGNGKVLTRNVHKHDPTRRGRL